MLVVSRRLALLERTRTTRRGVRSISGRNHSRGYCIPDELSRPTGWQPSGGRGQEVWRPTDGRTAGGEVNYPSRERGSVRDRGLLAWPKSAGSHSLLLFGRLDMAETKWCPEWYV